MKPTLYAGDWQELDRAYTASRRQLNASAEWRYGPRRVAEVAKEVFSAIKEFSEIGDKNYCDLGCGEFHPFGISAVMFLNGARSTVAIDIRDSNSRRAAEALADLLCDCICLPERWLWSNVTASEFIRRARRFNLNALQQGRLTEGLAEVPLRHVVTDIHDPVLEQGNIDVMSSRAVLEHFHDFKLAMRRLFDLTRPGGYAYHHIDLVDHRAYASGDYHSWSFLAEDENWCDGLCNRLRSCEIRQQLEEAGFEILRYDNLMEKMPPAFAKEVVGRFREMSEEELSITNVCCVLRRPRCEV